VEEAPIDVGSKDTGVIVIVIVIGGGGSFAFGIAAAFALSERACKAEFKACCPVVGDYVISRLILAGQGDSTSNSLVDEKEIKCFIEVVAIVVVGAVSTGLEERCHVSQFAVTHELETAVTGSITVCNAMGA
jgi:hypothetical protein